MKESALLRKFLLEYTKLGSRLFRNNVGMGWTGVTAGPVKKTATTTLKPGDIVIRKARPFRAGLPKGSSDLIGWTKVTITPDMVGREVAIFTAYEAKTESVEATKEQLNFVRTVNHEGGIAAITRKVEDILMAITKFENKGTSNEKRH